MTFDFSRQILKNTQIPNYIEIGSVEAKLFHANGADGQTDRTKPIVAFRNFSNEPKYIYTSWDEGKWEIKHLFWKNLI